MKIGVITDIHSNILALNVILKKFDSMGVEKIICCGDIMGIGINPDETIKMLMKRKDMLVSVRGNHEGYLLDGIPKYVHDEKIELKSEERGNHEWNHSNISKEAINFLSNLKKEELLNIDGVKIYCTHYPMDENGKYKKHIIKPSKDELIEMFNRIDADIYLFGHTHVFCKEEIGGKLYLNVGSLGCPGKEKIARAGVITTNSGKYTFEEIEEEYDVNSVIDEIKKVKMPLYKEILKLFYGVDSF